MMKKRVVVLVILAVGLVTISCRKLEQPPRPMGALPLQKVKFNDAIPKDYGTLVGVTQNPAAPAWAGLWFQKPDGTITVVFVDIDRGEIFETFIQIPRK
jgi:hypothetical protein